MKGELISKSIRFRPEDVEYIEAQQGNTFTEKLTCILEEYRKGEAKRKKQIEYYDNLILQRRKELQSYNDLAMKLAQVRREVLSIESSFSRIMDRLKDE